MKALLQLLRNVILGFPAAVRAVLAALSGVGRVELRPGAECCDRVTSPVVRIPDPLIYDQYYLWSLGLPFTWDNRDITIWHGTTQVQRLDLSPATTYEIVARIWNSSTDAPVAGLAVAFSYLSFGVGVQSNPIGRTHVNLGVRGGRDHPAFARMLWKTPATPGHYFQVLLEPFVDFNWSNNLGQENTQVVAAQSPAVSSFMLRNNTLVPQTYQFRADAYQLLPVAPCPAEETTAVVERTDAGMRAHLAYISAQPAGKQVAVPPGWRVTTAPERLELDPSEEIAIAVTIEPPPGFWGTQPINIHAFRTAIDGSSPAAILAGGVTFIVSAS